MSDEFPPDTSHLGTDQLTALAAIDALTGFGKQCTTCPRKYAAQPHVQRARLAYTYTQLGCPEYVEPNPPKAMLEAIENIGAGVNKRHRFELDEAQRKSEAAVTAAKGRIGRHR